VRKIDAEFRTHNKGRAISGQYLAAVLQCHKSEALTLLDEAFPDRAKRRADAIAAREEASG
jgi:histidinol-phosphate/aromatic aminotransferase/cobyric acid decarboxylase-like protein